MAATHPLRARPLRLTDDAFGVAGAFGGGSVGPSLPAPGVGAGEGAAAGASPTTSSTSGSLTHDSPRRARRRRPFPAWFGAIVRRVRPAGEARATPVRAPARARVPAAARGEPWDRSR